MIYRVRLVYDVDVYVTCSEAEDAEQIAADLFESDGAASDMGFRESSIVDEGPELTVPQYALRARGAQ